MISANIRTDWTGIVFTEIKTNRAKLYAFFDVFNGFTKFDQLLPGFFEQIKNQTLGCFGADAGKFGKLIN
jgi:hypothetical protein